jgi:hypothetical protein
VPDQSIAKAHQVDCPDQAPEATLQRESVDHNLQKLDGEEQRKRDQGEERDLVLAALAVATRSATSNAVSKLSRRTAPTGYLCRLARMASVWP